MEALNKKQTGGIEERTCYDLFIKELFREKLSMMRAPVLNLMGLVSLIEASGTDEIVLTYLKIELDKLDSIIVNTAREAIVPVN